MGDVEVGSGVVQGVRAGFERSGGCRGRRRGEGQIEIAGESEGQVSRAFAGEAADRGMLPWRECLLNGAPPIVKFYFSILLTRGEAYFALYIYISCKYKLESFVNPLRA